MNEWRKFFLYRIPVAAICVAVAVEIAAFLLSGIALHRHSVDDLATAVTRDTRPYPLVLLGDSITHNAVLKYRIGEPGEVADLVTHALAGLPSSLFLLKRYLESGHRPRHVILASSRDVFVLPVEQPTFKRYVTTVFTQDYERDFLQQHFPEYVNYSWRPAVLAMDLKLAEPLLSLLRRPGNDILAASTPPSPHPQLEKFADDNDNVAVFQDRLNSPDVLRPEARAIFAEMCRLSRQYGFELHIVWPPTEARLWSRLEAKGSLQRINTQLAAIAEENHTTISIDDTAAEREYPYFDKALRHLRGAGWEQTYALQLSSYAHRFEMQSARNN